MAAGAAGAGKAKGYRVDGRAVCTDPDADLRYGAQGFDSLVHYLGAGELAACARADFDGAVASVEQPVPAGDAARDAEQRQSEALTSGTEQPSEFLQQVMEAVHQFQGVSDSTMSHGEGWQFIQVGRYIERASGDGDAAGGLSRGFVGAAGRVAEGNEYLDWMGLLRSATAFEAYCKVYTADLTPDQILEFLLLDEEFPHSLRFSIDSLQCALEEIQGDSGRSRAEPLRRLGGRLQASLNYSSVDEILNQDVVGYLGEIQEQCRAIHETIYELYVDYSIQAALAG